MALPVRQSFTSICFLGVLLRAHSGIWWNTEVCGTKKEQHTVCLTEFEYCIKQGEVKIRLNSPWYCCKRDFTASFDETRHCFLLDVNKSESHKYLQAADHRRFDLALQGSFLKTAIQMHMYVRHNDNAQGQTPSIEKKSKCLGGFVFPAFAFYFLI